MAARTFGVGVVVVLLVLAGWGVWSLGRMGGAAPAATVAPAAEPSPTAAASPTATAPVTATTAVTAVAAAAPAANTSPMIHFRLDPDRSTARFIVDELLFGKPNTVVGSTNSVSGTLDVDPTDPAQTQVGPITVDARTLATDNRFRNRSLSRFILESNKDAYQYITFTPTALTGLPAAAQPGDVLEFQVTGDLTIRDVTQPVTFATVVTATSAAEISGLAAATVTRADFELTIPKVDGVADVAEEVRLELQFVAEAEAPR